MKKTAVKFFAIVLVGLLFTGCKHDTFTISGTLDGGAGKTLWLEELKPDGPLFIDSIPVDNNGHFKYKYKMPYPSFYNLHISQENYIVTLPDYGERVKINGNWENLSLTYTVSGSPESELLWQLQQQTNDGAAVLTDLVDTARRYNELLQQGLVDEAMVAAKHEITDSIYFSERELQTEYVHLFIEENKGSLSTIIALYKSFNTKPLINSRDTASLYWYNMVLEGLTERYPDNPHTVHFQSTVERMRSRLIEQ